MKCPKCGYVSFEYLDQCKSCGKGLESFKSEHGLYGDPPADLMVIKFLEDKAALEGTAAGETEEEGVMTVVGEEDEDLENIVSGIGGVTEDSESDEDSATEISLDLGEADSEEDAAEELVADLTESASEKESGEIELSMDEIEIEEPKTSTPATVAKNDSTDELSLDLDELNADLEIDDEITLEKPKPRKKDDDDELLTLELE